MKIIRPYYEIWTPISENGTEELKFLERVGRTCYRSEDKITDDSAPKFIRMLLDHTPPHEAILEHKSLTVKFICDRGVSHELVRHRLCSFAQESTRYCNYSKDKFGGQLTFIKPYFLEPGTEAYEYWCDSCNKAEDMYLAMLDEGKTPQEARSILPNSLKTEIVITTNYSEWRHILDLRTSARAHPQIRQLMVPLGDELMNKIPEVFDDVVHADRGERIFFKLSLDPRIGNS